MYADPKTFTEMSGHSIKVDFGIRSEQGNNIKVKNCKRYRGGVEAGAAWSGPGRRGGSRAAAMALMTRRAAPRTGRGRRGARRRGPGRRGRRRGVGAAGLGTTRRDGGLGTTSRAATVERRPGTHARPGKNAAAHAGERARGGKKKSGRRATSIGIGRRRE